MRTNIRQSGPAVVTHEGAPAKRIDAAKQLRRSVMSCLLWEKEFYEDGESIADRIAQLVPLVSPGVVAALAIEARRAFKLRHVPLFIVREMCRHPNHRALVAETLDAVIQRADEMGEFLSMYWKDGRCPVAAQVKKGLARAFTRFDEYALGKYDGEAAVKLRDVLFISHAKPANSEQAELWKRVVSRTLATPDTWEVALSGGAAPLETWVRLLDEKKLGALALLRNLRNMQKTGVPDDKIRAALAETKVDRVLPYRFIAAARYAPMLEPELEAAMFRCIEGMPKLPGRTILLVDVSGSMDSAMSAKSEITRIDAACGLAVLARELCEAALIVTFSNLCVAVPPRRGFALRDAVKQSQEHAGTYLGAAVKAVCDKEKADRLIVFTDEQSHDQVSYPSACKRAYMVNVASAKNGVGYGKWTHIDGFSEAVLGFIRESEE